MNLPMYLKSIPIAGEDYELNLPKDHLSFSQISSYLRCPSYYYHDHVLGIERKKSLALVEGLVHSQVIEESNLRRWKGKSSLSSKDAIRKYRAFFQEEIVGIDWASEDETEEDILDRMERFYLKMFSSDSKFSTSPETINNKPGVEYEWNKKYAGVEVVGRVDLIEQDTLWDIKCVKREPNPSTSLQLAFYADVLQRSRVGFICLLKRKDPYVISPTAKLNLSLLPAVLESTVARVAQAISLGIFTPCDSDNSWWCSEKMCSYWKGCRGFAV